MKTTNIEWEYIDNIGLPSDMVFGFGTELDDFMEYKVSDNLRYCIFNDGSIYYVIKQFIYNGSWVEDWTKQMSRSKQEAMKYAESDYILNTM